MNFWFHAHVVEELAELLAYCQTTKTASSQLLALAVFSSLIVGASKQDSETRYVRRDKVVRPGDTAVRFKKALTRAISNAALFRDQVAAEERPKVIAADVLSRPAVGEVDLVVTSPPYPNAYSYHLYHRLRMIWLGFDDGAFKEQEIGSHRKYSRRGPLRATAETFASEMSDVFAWLSDVVRPDGLVCVVVGDSTINGERVDNAAIVRDAARRATFQVLMEITRPILATKKSFNPALGKIKDERLLVFRS
jgi:site-specific DNA-methyltransferase (cytosine-N4-specific)